jgi:hypothetical protein
MKKSILLFVLIVCTYASYSQNPIFNPGFESWTTQGNFENCNDWGNYNDFFVQNGAQPCSFKTTDAHSGNFAIELKSQLVQGDSAAGTILSGNFDFTQTEFIPNMKVTKLYDSLEFWYKYTPVATDSFAVIVIFSRWDNATASRVPVSISKYTTGGNVNTWTKEKFKMTPSQNGIPDSCVITFLSSGGGQLLDNPTFPGTSLKVDDVTFTGVGSGTPNAINSYKEDYVKVIAYPNPAKSYIRISNIADDATIYLINLQGSKIRLNKDINNKINLPDNIAPGLYTVEVIDINKLERKNLVLQISK